MKRAFTLVEALVVIAILIFLAVIFFPPGTFRSHENARRSSCQSNLKQLALAFLQYQQDADSKLPLVARKDSRGWAEDVQPYLKNWQIFQCPSGASGTQQTSDYFYNARLNGAKLDSLDAIAATINCGDGPDGAPLSSHLSALPPAALTNSNSFAQRHLGGANYGFVDGHVKWFKPEKISTASPKSGGWTFALR